VLRYFILIYPPFSRRGLSHFDNSPDWAEIFLYVITGSAISTFFWVNTEDIITLDNRSFGADAIPDTGMALYAFLPDFV
jgi:hypothetical protein